ncbi:helix-turn-helix transcriptional regulator [Chishuiella sp.]|uniref:helix-turn-helix domain-containing protein n=1 Tax=Chishuiella sp. TaxID=1969467 RepID=UPI0028AB9A6B|nr:helix-turn-helix transcriptional regulator [Chishuiella sp.]
MENTISIVIGVVIAVIIFSIVLYTILRKRSKLISEQTNEAEKSSITITEKSNSENHSDIVDEEIPKKAIINEPIEEIQPSINISSKTEKEILKKLEYFEKNKGFIKKDVNLNSLSKQFNTNTKYLSEIIKIHRNKQFNAYLNELRINYITARLLNEPNYLKTKITYLASDCGYSSHSTFTTIFTQLMNESPSVYIKRIKKDVHSK